MPFLCLNFSYLCHKQAQLHRSYMLPYFLLMTEMTNMCLISLPKWTHKSTRFCIVISFLGVAGWCFTITFKQLLYPVFIHLTLISSLAIRTKETEELEGYQSSSELHSLPGKPLQAYTPSEPWPLSFFSSGSKRVIHRATAETQSPNTLLFTLVWKRNDPGGTLLQIHRQTCLLFLNGE